jgi:hypothetical protein
MATTIKNSVLLKTSSANDVKCSGGNLTITGINDLISKKDISSIFQVKYRAEVAQVVTVGASSYTPTSSTTYTVFVYDPLRSDSSNQESPKGYSYTTPVDVTTLGNAAAQREAIHAAIIAKINADRTCHATGATLGGGTGFTITDDGGYWPVRSQTMTNVKGINTVYTVYDANGQGFGDSEATVTTAGVYSSGVGAKLAQESPVVDLVYGNLISGELVAPPLAPDGTAAVSGQNYDTFVISSLKVVSAHNVTGQFCYQERFTRIYVDNGTGTSTANLAGFIAFERALRKQLSSLYSDDKNSLIDFFDSPSIFQGAAGAVPTATGENKAATGYGQWVYNMIGSGTITTPTPANTGLNLDLDAATTEGLEITPSLLTVNSQGFVVGQQEFSITVKNIVTDHTDADMLVGFRIKAAHAADFNNYTDLGAIGFIADLVYTWGILNNAATVATNTTVAPTDAAYEEYIVKVDIDGNVTCFRNGVEYPVYSVGTTPLVFDAGDTMIPFVRAVNNGGGDPDVIINQLLSVADPNWIS